MNLDILVTGGAGFLGSAICRQLLDSGHQVRAFQRSAAPELEALGATVIRGDLCDERQVREASRGCDAIIHTAAKAGVWGKLPDYHAINIGGTQNVLEACAENGIRLLVHTSSPSVVHSGGDIEGADESIPIARHFKAPYPETKATAEKLVLAANGEALRTVALRPHLIWGPGDPHILPRLAEKASGGTLRLPGPDKLIDTVFVENAALAHVLALEELAGDGRCAGKPYFITNHEPLPQGEIIQRLLRAIGIEAKIRAVPLGLANAVAGACEFTWKVLPLKSEPPATRFAIEQLATAHWFDPSAAEQDFGYRPRYSIAEGLEQLSGECDR